LCTYEDAKAVTQRADELGINYFDCARIYWNGKSEEVDVLPPFRKHIFLTTKSPQRTRKGAEEDLERFLRALKTDYLDLWQIHQVSTMEEVHQIFAPGGAVEAFEAAKKAAGADSWLHRSPRSRGLSRHAEVLRQVRHDPDAVEPGRFLVPELRENGAALGPSRAAWESRG
jgi:aryl-alcohol dehydrogenase-like predicted oxidoreductase